MVLERKIYLAFDLLKGEKHMKKHIILGCVLALLVGQEAFAQTAASATKEVPKAAASDTRTYTSKKSGYRDKVLAELPADKAASYRSAMEQAHSKNQPLYDQIKVLKHDLSGLMTAEKFDKAAYLAKQAEIEKLYSQMHVSRAEALASLIETWTVADRKTLEKLHGSHKSRHSKGAESNAGSSEQF